MADLMKQTSQEFIQFIKDKKIGAEYSGEKKAEQSEEEKETLRVMAEKDREQEETFRQFDRAISELDSDGTQGSARGAYVQAETPRAPEAEEETQGDSEEIVQGDDGQKDEPSRIEEEEETEEDDGGFDLDPSMIGEVVQDVEEDIEEKGTGIVKKPAEKVGYDDLIGASGKARAPARLNKKLVLICITAALGGFFLLTNLAFAKSKKDKTEEETEQKKEMAFDVSSWGLGVKKKEGEKTEELKEETIVPVAKKSTATKVEYKKPPEYQKTPTTYQAPAKSTSVPAPVNTLELEAIKAPLGKEIDNYGSASGRMYDAGYVGSGTGASTAGTGSQGFDRQGYIESVKQMAASVAGATAAGSGVGGSSEEKKADSARVFQNGAYTQVNDGGGNITPLSDTVLFPGTIIPAVLVSAINTDYPADITARVTQNVYDSKTGQNLLIPQGSILRGTYSSSSVGVKRVQIAWTDLIISKNGIAYMTTLGGMAGVDAAGQAGVAGMLDDHYWEWLKAAGIMSMFTILNAEITYQTKAKASGTLKTLMDSNQAIVNSIGNKMVDRAMEIVPTVKVAGGTRVSVSVNTALKLVPFESVKPEQRYEKK